MQQRKAVQLEGLLRLLEALSGTTSGLTWAELADLTGLTERSVRRYLRAAAECDVSFDHVRGDDGRVRVRYANRGPSLPLRIGLDETLALAGVRAVALAAMDGLPWQAPLHRLFTRLNAAVPEGLRELFAGERASFGAAAGSGRAHLRGDVWAELERARREKRAVAIRYRSLRRTAERRFEPYVTYVAEGTAYVYGFDHLRSQRGTFAIERILSVQPLALRFERPRDVTPEGVVAELHRGYRANDQIDVVLVASGRAARLWEERPEVPGQSIERLGRNRVRIRFQAPDTPALRARLLSFGAAVEVEAPAPLRTAMAAEAERLARVYGAVKAPRSVIRSRSRAAAKVR